MAYDYSDLVEKTQDWAERACSLGWFGKEAAQQLAELETRTPESLFNQTDSRPLIVAFMGGSGVGKSTLLNRLAGKPIAHTGVERPTSREVTLFHHSSVAMQQLPGQFPITQIKIAQHEEESKKNLIWIDMPDFDSTEQSNKQLVLQWLPHIDVLIYVVSPERYRDEKAWQILLAEGARHAWLFVLNQWDRGQEEQYDDFKQQLHKAGFYEPIIFKTACTENLQIDEFAALEETITALATSHVIEQLEQRGLHLRKQELVQKLCAIGQLLGNGETFQQAPTLWHKQWQETTKLLQQGFTWPLQQAAAYYAEHAADLLASERTAYNALWDAWAQARFDDALDDLVLAVDQLGIPVIPLKNQLLLVREKAGKITQTQIELGARQALANPGNVFQRGFLKCMRLCEITLPLAAMSWVGYQVFVGYYHSNMTNMHYLGADFAIHSSLLIAMTWLAPYFILKKAQPSLKKAALGGLNRGLTNALSIIDSEVAAVLEAVRHEHTEQVQLLAELVSQCTDTNNVQQRLSIENNSPLNRMLVE
ncbi:MAG: 50S ribosome-binding GTPase [Methylovulum sp.]|nr:50S ribosome-binding GTPase [Methylovulum sp.]